MASEYLTVESDGKGLRIDEFLTLHYPRWTKGYLRNLVRRGLVQVDGNVHLLPDRRLNVGNVVLITLPEGEYTPIHTRVKLDIEVLYEDESIWVIDKPPGVAVEPERWARDGAHLAGAVLDHLEDDAAKSGASVIPFRPRVVHRLDKGTSGVLVFAKNLEAERALRAQFRNREVHKEYYAMVDGEVPAGGGEVDLPLRPGKRNRMKVARGSKGRAALTRYEVAEAFRGFTWVRCFPLTGRTHQIRVHLAARGFPLVVDSLYGRREALLLSEFKSNYRRSKGHRERPLLERLSLHAAAIELASPAAGRVRIESPLAKDLAVVLKQMQRWRTQ